MRSCCLYQRRSIWPCGSGSWRGKNSCHCNRPRRGTRNRSGSTACFRTGTHRLTIDQYRAGPAHGDAAAELRPGNVGQITQGPQQGHVGRGIDVDYVILLDATNPRTVPANVNKCHNIYLSHQMTDWFPAFRGISVWAESDETELINYDVRYSTDRALSSGDFNHFDIETDPEIQKLMTDLIRARFNNDPNVARILPPNDLRSIEQ